MSSDEWNTGWTEKAEIEFINGIGTHSEYGTRFPVIKLLQGYRESLIGRVYWSGISKYSVLRAIDDRIEKTKESK